jgi:hypothetical protein
VQARGVDHSALSRDSQLSPANYNKLDNHVCILRLPCKYICVADLKHVRSGEQSIDERAKGRAKEWPCSRLHGSGEPERVSIGGQTEEGCIRRSNTARSWQNRDDGIASTPGVIMRPAPSFRVLSMHTEHPGQGRRSSIGVNLKDGLTVPKEGYLDKSSKPTSIARPNHPCRKR